MTTVEERRSFLVRWGIIICFCLFVVLPLIILLITNLTQADMVIPEEEALQSDVDAETMQVIRDKYESDIGDYVMHEISRVDGYVIVLIIDVTTENYDDSSLVIVDESKENYSIVYNGQVYNDKFLRKANIPDRVVNEVRNKNTLIRKYLIAVSNASINPINEYPLISVLPYSSDSLNISYYYEGGSDTPVVEISAIDATDRKNALTVIRNLCECEPAEYNLRYVNFVNPFTGEDR